MAARHWEESAQQNYTFKSPFELFKGRDLHFQQMRVGTKKWGKFRGKRERGNEEETEKRSRYERKEKKDVRQEQRL